MPNPQVPLDALFGGQMPPDASVAPATDVPQADQPQDQPVPPDFANDPMALLIMFLIQLFGPDRIAQALEEQMALEESGAAPEAAEPTSTPVAPTAMSMPMSEMAPQPAPPDAMGPFTRRLLGGR